MKIDEALARRFGADVTEEGENPLETMAARGSVRAFRTDPVPIETIRLLAATALSGPTKSDLQQRDIVLVREPELKARLLELVADQPWTQEIPTLLVFCGNNRRQRLLHDWHGIEFANDHLDAFVNATADAAIVLASFVHAAEAIGLGTCPISAMRNHPDAVSDLLGLPDHVFPFAGLALGYPARPARVSYRLPLDVTFHENRYSETRLREKVAAYDSRRQADQPYRTQRLTETFGSVTDYGWSLDKARQYSRPERADFGDFIRRKGFRL